MESKNEEKIGTIQKELACEVENFKAMIKKEPCVVYFGTDAGKIDNREDIELYIDALYQGYLDACRTIHWKTDENNELLKRKKEWDKKASHESTEKKNNPGREPLEQTAQEIKAYLENEDSIFEHKKWCTDLIEKYEKYIKGGITYGQAQKIINMAFKYLYCIYGRNGRLENKKDKFSECHMPLDSFSLEWFKRSFKSEWKNYLGEKEKSKLPDYLFKNSGELKTDSISSWSSMHSVEVVKEHDSYQRKKYPYEFYHNIIKKYCDEDLKKSISPLQLDFVVWDKMQKIMAAEDFIKAFAGKRNFACNDYHDITNLTPTLNERVDEIQRILDKK